MSAVSPTVPTHCTVMVVVGSRCQVRNSVLGWNGASSVSFSTDVRAFFLSEDRTGREAGERRTEERTAGGQEHGGTTPVV